MDVLTEDECELFTNALQGERRATMFSLALATGLRPGELRQQRRNQNEERLKLGPAWQNYDLVFPSEVGTPPTHSNITRVFKRVLRNAEHRTTLRLYDLCHTHATLLLKAGIHAKIVSERLGDSSIALTLDIYSHVLPSMQIEATTHLERMLYSRNGTS